MENEYTDPFIKATEWMFQEQICAPEIKANNHRSNMSHLVEFNRKSRSSNVWGDDQQNCYHYNGTIIQESVFSADQTPESYSHQVFIDYTNENTNRA